MNNLRIKGGNLNSTGPWCLTCSIGYSKELMESI